MPVLPGGSPGETEVSTDPWLPQAQYRNGAAATKARRPQTASRAFDCWISFTRNEAVSKRRFRGHSLASIEGRAPRQKILPPHHLRTALTAEASDSDGRRVSRQRNEGTHIQHRSLAPISRHTQGASGSDASPSWLFLDGLEPVPWPPRRHATQNSSISGQTRAQSQPPIASKTGPKSRKRMSSACNFRSRRVLGIGMHE